MHGSAQRNSPGAMSEAAEPPSDPEDSVSSLWDRLRRIGGASFGWLRSRSVGSFFPSSIRNAGLRAVEKARSVRFGRRSEDTLRDSARYHSGRLAVGLRWMGASALAIAGRNLRQVRG